MNLYVRCVHDISLEVKASDIAHFIQMFAFFVEGSIIVRFVLHPGIDQIKAN